MTLCNSVQHLCFSINVQHLSHKFGFNGDQRCQRLKHRWEPKTHKIAFTGEVLHIYDRAAIIMSKKRRCTIAGITVLFALFLFKLSKKITLKPWVAWVTNISSGGKGKRTISRMCIHPTFVIIFRFLCKTFVGCIQKYRCCLCAPWRWLVVVIVVCLFRTVLQGCYLTIEWNRSHKRS